MQDDAMSGLIDGIGLIAGLLTTTAFIPQVWKIYQTKSGRDISARMISLFTTGLVLWLIYGILLRSVPLILSNAVTLSLSLAIVVLKIRYRDPPSRDGRDA
jgi:MtN3 and saliva related transmembrane protein